MTAFQRIAAIHDISCYGKCSLTIAIPVLSSMGLEVCPLPTASLSSHTGINNFSFIDLTENMKKTISH
jgi:pyridoxine kinase